MKPTPSEIKILKEMWQNSRMELMYLRLRNRQIRKMRKELAEIKKKKLPEIIKKKLPEIIERKFKMSCVVLGNPNWIENYGTGWINPYTRIGGEIRIFKID